ncbi:inner membrane protein YpjD [Cellvibrio zantedeschiae]|uniref:Inner membrane protein YpjD n=1 Tax=Cellvibrio zantedeschiae TaxID=1237077 RepID=A0ABQ3AYF2_9GAMM|nr:cytochrome c biogenesis protein CcsA [Cellvibrio zantedeschiae]GGY70630.1 inner membrane protein YpjD [Cellvibrio zantedeschiae]
MLFVIANITAAVLYAALGIYLARQLIQQKDLHLTKFLAGIGLTLAIHAIGIYGISVKPEGVQLSFFTVSSQIFWVINAIVLLSSLKKALHNLFIFLLPCSALAIVTTLYSHTESTILQLNYTLASHVILSIIAYSLLTIATLQAMLLSYQNRHLKSRTGLQYLRYLPPLQTMEALLFEFVLVGQILLTLSILSGFIFLDNIFAQHLVHKTVFSIAAWIVYGFLLLGKYKLGWRGNTAIRWTLAGFLFLMLAYFGSKLVLEIILQRV